MAKFYWLLGVKNLTFSFFPGFTLQIILIIPFQALQKTNLFKKGAQTQDWGSMIIYHQQLEKVLLYFQWLSTALTALQECMLPSISVLKQVIHVSLQKPKGKNQLILQHPSLEGFWSLPSSSNKKKSKQAHFPHWFSSQGIQKYSPAGLCIWVYLLFPLSCSLSSPVLLTYLYFLTSFIFLSFFSPL